MIRRVYRNKGGISSGGAHAGRTGNHPSFSHCLTPRRIQVDAVLLTSDDASIVFDSPGPTSTPYRPSPCHVKFLQTIMPAQRVDELYTSDRL